MPDTLTPEQRSERMSRVRAKNTGPELIVRRLVHSLGYCRDDCDRYGRETHPRLLRARALRLQDWRDLHELRAVSDVHGSDLLVEDAARLLFEHEGGCGQGRIRRRAHLHRDHPAAGEEKDSCSPPRGRAVRGGVRRVDQRS